MLYILIIMIPFAYLVDKWDREEVQKIKSGGTRNK